MNTLLLANANRLLNALEDMEHLGDEDLSYLTDQLKAVLAENLAEHIPLEHLPEVQAMFDVQNEFFWSTVQEDAQ